MQCLAPDYLYTAQGLQSGKIVSISDAGLILSISEATDTDAITTRLPGVALLPGFVNVHSHVFQRALRGRTHHALAVNDTFWTWRRAMYMEAQRLDPDSLYQVARQTYREMLLCGYTSVGEFHYVHHQPDGKPYEHENAMSEAVIQAGRDAGIRVVLLLVAYAQSDFDQPPEDEQRRFCDASVDTFLTRTEALRLAGVSLGIAPHSVRAVPESWFRPIVAYCEKYNLPLHIHADEQQAEIDRCQQARGCAPIELLDRYEMLGPRTTIVHATHANSVEIGLLAKYQSTVCVCPTTEGDLGDGIAPYEQLLAADIPLTIGSDSNTRLDPFEELRWAEYTARMRYQRRRVLVPDELASPGPLLLDYATRYGAHALNLTTGVIAPGMAADFIAIDLHHPMLSGSQPENLLDTLFFGADSRVIMQTWVQGRALLV